MNLFKKLKAQIALEALIILGVFIIGVVIFATFYFQSITPKDQVDFEFGSDRVFNKTPNSPLVIIDDPDPEDPDYPDDPEPPEAHTFSNLVLILDPETSSLVNQDFNVIARINSNYDSANVDLIEVTKYDDFFGSYGPNSSCELNGSYASSFSNAGTLVFLDSNHLSNSFTFSCNSPGQYNFKFTVSNDNDSEILFNDLEGSEYFDGKEIEIDTLCLAGQPGEGSGTEEDPKIICTPKELHDVRDHMDWYYVLGQDIDLNHTILSNDPTATWYDDAKGWTPIDASTEYVSDGFAGNFDGQRNSIFNLYINNSVAGSINNYGLFGYTNTSSEIRDLILEDVNIWGRHHIGGLVGTNNGNLSNITIIGKIIGRDFVGGLVGQNYGTISNCSSNIEIISSGGNIGGLVGGLFDGLISSSHSTGAVSGSSNVGGLVGQNYNFANILNSYSGAEVNASLDYSGGLVGINGKNADINNSYSIGPVFSQRDGAGGLVGFNGGNITNSYSASSSTANSNYSGGLIGRNYGNIFNSYAVGQVNANNYKGGLVGLNNFWYGGNNYIGTVLTSYYDSISTGQSDTGKGDPKTTSEMTTQSTFTDWNFTPDTGVWQIQEGCYPILRENPQSPLTCPEIESNCDNPIGAAVFNPAGGTFSNPINVSLSYEDPSCLDYNIHYTTNGTDPTPSSPIYSSVIPLSTTTTVKAKVFAKNSVNQDVNGDTNTQIYNISSNACNDPLGAVSFNIVGGTFSNPINVSLSYTDPKCLDYNIYYIVAESPGIYSEPTTSSIRYTSPIVLSSAGLKTIKAKVFARNSSNIEVAGISKSETYFIMGTVLASPLGGTSKHLGYVVDPLSVTLSLSHSEYNEYCNDCNIRYTTNLVEPTIDNSIIYTGTIPINITTKLRAKIFGKNSSGSIISSAELNTDYWICSSAPGESGLGTVASPKVIKTPQQLSGIYPSYLHCNYILGQDIDLNVAPYNTGSGWLPIGNYNSPGWYPFIGTFDGNGHKIKNLYINRPTEDYIGLFGYTYPGANIRNLILENVNITGRNLVGSLIGYGEHSTIQNIYSTGNVSGDLRVGGVVGNSSYFDLISTVHSGVNVQGGSYVGGLVGQDVYGKIDNSYSVGTISGTSYIGGLIGSTAYSDVSLSYSTSKVSGTNYIGGLVGIGSFGSISNSYSLGDVTRLSGVSTDVGGFLAYSVSETVANCYSKGRVMYAGATNPTNRGFSSNSITGNNYWDTQTSLQSTSGGGATGKTTSQMKTQGTFTDWDFTNIWAINPTINNGYPYLRDNPPQ